MDLKMPGMVASSHTPDYRTPGEYRHSGITMLMMMTGFAAACWGTGYLLKDADKDELRAILAVERGGAIQPGVAAHDSIFHCSAARQSSKKPDEFTDLTGANSKSQFDRART
jgi:hypothetical protein